MYVHGEGLVVNKLFTAERFKTLSLTSGTRSQVGQAFPLAGEPSRGM